MADDAELTAVATPPRTAPSGPVSSPSAKPAGLVQTVKDYGARLLRFIRSRVGTDEDAEDVLQDVWQQFISASATDTIEQVSGWLHAVARNRITDRQRKKKPELIDDLGWEDEDGELHLPHGLLTSDDDPETEHLRAVFWDVLFAALDELPESQRTVFVQNELEDKTLQQIADETGANLKTVISRKRYAVQHLRRRLQFLYDDLLDS